MIIWGGGQTMIVGMTSKSASSVYISKPEWRERPLDSKHKPEKKQLIDTFALIRWCNLKNYLK